MAAKFPLYKHANGQWCKTIRGKKHYFGTDQDEALTKYLAEKDYLATGRPLPVDTDGVTLAELVNVYLDRSRKRVARKQESERNFQDYLSTLNRLADFCGDEDQPANWRPDDFEAIKESFFQPVERTSGPRGHAIGKSVERRAPTTVDGDIARVRAFLKWCANSDYIPMPRYGASFNKSSRRERRRVQANFGRRDLSADAIQRVIDKASVHAKPLFLLSINGAMGATDLASLTLEQLDGSAWLDCPRMKTGVERRIWIWPETLEAIECYLKKRPTPNRTEWNSLAFLTSRGSAWVRGNESAISKAFLKTRRACGLERGEFYDLRRTFQTVAEGTKDFPAVQQCMGHASSSGDMASVYRQAIEDDRIQAVCEYVRDWLVS